MCKQFKYIFSFILMLGVVCGIVNADPYQQEDGPDGIVSIEAENFDENTPRPPHTWDLITESAGGFVPPDGFSGGAAMQSMPADPGAGDNFNDPGDFLANSPRLDYEVNFSKTGTHYVWVLAWGLDGSSDSIHSGLDGEHIDTADRISGFNNNYTWTNTPYQDAERVSFDVTSAGVHTVNIWMREDGAVVDKIVLTTNPDYTPTGAGPDESSRGPRFKAYGPVPEDGVLYTDTWASLSWVPGDTAVSHDVYFGDNFTDVNSGAESVFQGNQAATLLIVGFPGYPYPDGLVPGKTYYWRIDEVEADGATKYEGDVWSFWIPPYTAYDPAPSEGAKYIDTDISLVWTAGFGTKLNYIFFGNNFEDVNNATVGKPLGSTSYTPGTLELGTTYYWRVDEFDGAATHKGDIWSFTTLPNIPVTDPNLVGWWKFEAGGGTIVIDFSGHGNHGTIIDNVQWVPGQFNLALEFPGDNEGHVELPPGMVNTAQGSVTMWVSTNLTGNEGMFWYGTETGGDGFGDENEIHIHNQDSGALGFGLEGSTDIRLNGPALPGAGWTHVAVTWDLTDGCRLYANGQQVDFAAHNNTVANLNTIRLGRPVGTGNGNRYHQGLMDDVRLFNHAISAEQVNEIMTKGEDPLRAGAPNPGNGSLVPVKLATPLSWSPGENASEHDVYFGTERDAVTNVDQTDTTGIYRVRQGATSYNPPEGVEWGGGPYYWRIDEINTDGTISIGSTWSFTVADFIVIDDFESYNDINEGEPGSNRIYLTWVDGFDDPTNGSQVGHLDPPFAERTIVNSGGQSMPLYYDNAVGKSEATMTLSSNRDWTQEGVGVLSLWFYGDTTNAVEPMYVVLNGTASINNDNPDVALIDTWTEWRIDLQVFADQGVNLSNVNSITIGFGNRTSPIAGGSGLVFFDDIRLYRAAP